MLKLLVNLDSDTQRYEYVNSQFQKLGIDITRVSAVDLRKASEDELKQYVAKLTSFNKLMRFPRTLLKGEVGCFLSHRKCWETLVKSNENYAFICEDDIVIADSIKEYLSDEKFLISELYTTFVRESPKGIKIIMAGNPYSVYCSIFSGLNVDSSKLKPGSYVVGPDYVIDCFKVGPELAEQIRRNNPMFIADEEYTRYAFGGESINDANIRLHK